MEFVVYILYAEKYNIHYTGYTSDLINRFYSHNIYATKGFTVKYRPWKVIHVEFYKTKKEALNREKFLKSGQGRGYIKNIIKY